MNDQQDRLFAAARQAAIPEAFRFDEAVATVFPDMLRRSIPGYAAVIAQSGLLAARFAKPGTNLYDLGCSLGATTAAMRDALLAARTDDPSRPPFHLCGVDNSAAMIDRARDELTGPGQLANDPRVHLELREADLAQTPLTNASVVALNFTLQFVDPGERERLMHRIASALVPGGVLILSEKIRFDDPATDRLYIEMYHDFKRANGYSDLEISQKRDALENVLIPDTLETHLSRLNKAGLQGSVWFQCFNFISLIAIRPE